MPNIETIFWHEAESGAKGELGIDDNGALYWNGKPVVTKQKVTLQWWVNLSAILAALSTVAMAILALLTYLNETNLNEKYSKSIISHEMQLTHYNNELEALKAKNIINIKDIEQLKEQNTEHKNTLESLKEKQETKTLNKASKRDAKQHAPLN